LVGLGEDPDELVAGAAELIEHGVYPFVVPYRPIPGTLAYDDGVPAPRPELLAEVTARVAKALQAAGMRGADQAAGCAACGACSALSAVGG
jgi:biotin synthase-related radical SAM superfamily protein